MSLGAVGVLVMPASAFAATTSDPAVDQQPLTVQPTVPPNIVLMLDDSGSMNWNFMPDWDYLENNSNNDAVIDSANNGVYYDPTITYTPPPSAQTGTYTNETDMTNVPEDGFGIVTTDSVNLFTYDGSYDYYACGGGVCQGSDVDYNTSTTVQVPATLQYDQTVNADYDWQCVSGDPGWGQRGCNYNHNGRNSGHLANVLTEAADAVCTDTFNSNSGIAGTLVFTGRDKDSDGNWTDGECQFSYTGTQTKTFDFFQYSTGAAAGPYTVHYVAASTADCANAPTPTNCVAMDDTSGTSAPSGVAVSTNVANWFAYYHTRILMAKTGLMTGFSNLSSTYRFGFGSINGNNDGDLPSPTGTFGDNNNEIAEVQPFGDGASGTQKAAFWNWVANENANNSTPLRRSLQAVGEYYQTEQPWESTSGDPGYSSTGTNKPLACRAAYTILTTDGFWNGGNPDSIGDADGTAGPTITNPDGDSYTYSPAQPYTDSLITVSTSYQSATCSKNSATLDTATGNCNWTGIQYKQYWYSSTVTQYGSGYSCSKSPYSGYSSCKGISGSYGVCASITNATWDVSHQQCKVTTTTGTTYSNTLADVAMYYWNHDLQDGNTYNGNASYNLDNEVPTSSEDPAFWQHMTTFTMGLGFTPVGISPTGTTVSQILDWADGGTAISGFSWPQPSSNSSYNIADLAHAAVNGHGDFFSATSPQAFTSGIESALNRVSQRVGTGSSLAANSTSLDTGTVIYQANYYTSVWKGDLKAYPVDATTGDISATANWAASTEMPTAANRTIETYNTSTGKFVAFKNTASAPPSLSSTQLAALGSDATTQEAIVNYLRGDSSGEVKNGGSYRSRDTALGDVVHSQPVYSGPPNVNEFVNQSFLGNITGSDGTIPFYTWAVGTTNASGKLTASAASTRTPLIFVDANDGMLHAFNASTGAEVYAYLPGAVITTGLKDLADTSYGQSSDPHQYFNDGQLTIADAYIDTGDGNGQSWHTILVGTTGLGLAKTVFALDVTNPASIEPLWERSAGDGLTNSDYIGQMVGKPVIAQTDYTPKSGTTPASSTWSVLIGNGYNSTKGVAALLQFNLATGSLTVHATDSSAGNGLAAPLAWMDTPTNGVADIAYAGDVLGRVWSFALNDTTGANATPSSTGTKLFTAEDKNGKAQPITAGMLAGTNPATGDVWLFFGTGQYLSDADLSNTDTQTWYGIIVQSATASLVSNLSNGRSALTERTITAQTTASGTTLAARSVSAPVANDMNGKSGWYMDLQNPNTTSPEGERMVDPNEFQGSVLIGVTRIPKVSDVCNPSGTGWVMGLDPFTGTAPSNDFFDVNGDGSVNSGDRVGGNVAAGVGFSSLPNAPIFVGGAMETSFDNGSNSTIDTAGSSGSIKRVSWRELVNP
jgi:type IV pilus assembly protein PilY1